MFAAPSLAKRCAKDCTHLLASQESEQRPAEPLCRNREHSLNRRKRLGIPASGIPHERLPNAAVRRLGPRARSHATNWKTRQRSPPCR